MGFLQFECETPQTKVSVTFDRTKKPTSNEWLTLQLHNKVTERKADARALEDGRRNEVSTKPPDLRVAAKMWPTV